MFENEYTLDKKLITEYVISILAKNTILTGVLLFVLGVIMYCIEEGNMRLIMIICSLVGLISAIVLPLVMVNSFEKAAKRLNNGIIEKTQVLFNDNIVMNEGKVHLEFEYSQIVKIKQTKSFIFLYLGDKSGILVYKDGFIKGDLVSFMDFIKEKTNK